jgi:hypothetical protein
MCGIVLLGGFLALWPVQRQVDYERGALGEVAGVLYLPSGGTLRRLSLGYGGLLADIYWTRAVQYFGRKRLAHSTQFEMLGPLLRITTELDPHLLTAYRFGSVFLAEKPPWGAGEPEQALALLRRGIVANPEYWRLWQDLGFVYYWDLKDYSNAAKVFRVGSERPGALPWMKVLAAAVAAQGGALGTSRLLWLEIYRQADTDSIRKSALDHLMALDAAEQLRELNALLALYRQREGRMARAFQELLAAGYLRTFPQDPSGAPYALGPDGQARLAPQSKVNLGLLQ